MNCKCKYEKISFGFILCGDYDNTVHCCDIKNCYYKDNIKLKNAIFKISKYGGLDNTNQLIANEIIKELNYV